MIWKNERMEKSLEKKKRNEKYATTYHVVNIQVFHAAHARGTGKLVEEST